MRRLSSIALAASLMALAACTAEAEPGSQDAYIVDDGIVDDGKADDGKADGDEAPDLAALAATLQGEGEPLESYVDPERGLYVITRPGAMDDISWQADLSDLEAWEGDTWILDGLGDTSCELSEEMPPLGCYAEEVYPSGCFHEPADGYERLTTIASFREQFEMDSYSDEQMEAMATTESQLHTRVALADAKITLYFGQVDGTWVLLLVDAAEQDCGA
jgi:hypothetical protein